MSRVRPSQKQMQKDYVYVLQSKEKGYKVDSTNETIKK